MKSRFELNFLTQYIINEIRFYHISLVDPYKNLNNLEQAFHLLSFEPKIIKKVIDGQENWFEEISEWYEEVVIVEDDLEDELSLGQQMDLGQLIDNYDIPEDCFEEQISIYEYYDIDEQDVQENQSDNFKVHDLGEEEQLRFMDSTNEISNENAQHFKQDHHSKQSKLLENQVRKHQKNKKYP